MGGSRLRQVILTVAVSWLWYALLAAAEQTGVVTSNGVPVPGAVITASRDGIVHSTTSDAGGRYQLGELDEGTWRIRVEMTGFEPIVRDVEIGAAAPAVDFSLSLVSFASLKETLPLATPAVIAAPAAPAQAGSRAERRDERPAAIEAPPADPAALDPGAADSYLVNGSVNNGAASPFAQAAAFGNNRRSGRSLYNGSLGIVFGDSRFDARPYSFSDRVAPRPSYRDTQWLGTFGGPLRWPGTRTGPSVFIGYQRSINNIATGQSALVPGGLERLGDFSQSIDAAGRSISPVDPSTGEPFPDRRIPAARISPSAAALLGLYPAANAEGSGYNFETSVLSRTQMDNVQFRATQSVGRRDSVFGSVLYSRNQGTSRDMFGFTDVTTTSTLESTINWQRRLSQFTSLRTRYQATLQASSAVPYFSGRSNVSGDAGIAGNDQSPENWGPPSLSFSDGLATLGTIQYADNHGATHVASAELLRTLGRHGLTVGGGAGWQRFDLFGQQDARGTLSFTGMWTGTPLADFLLGLPATSAIAYGNPDKRLRGRTAHAYVNDDWRVSPSLTVNAGVRWEMETPLGEALHRLANIDVAPGFSSASTVLPGQSSSSGRTVPEGLVSTEWRFFQPRLGVAWRPIAGSSLVVRGGYGIYRNTGVYSALAVLLAQQPPFSKSFNVASSTASPLSLSNAFSVDTAARPNTFGVDPGFRVGYAQIWQLSAQRDLPASLTIVGTYFGTSGHRLMQQFLPNTYPDGSSQACPSCPVGFVYLASNGTSLRNAGQVQLRRRLRNGFMASAQYTLGKSTDNASAFVPNGSALQAGPAIGATSGSTGIAGASIAQNWLDLDAEYARSNFDERHQLTMQVQYTSGQGVTSGALLDGIKGKLLNGWTLTMQATLGSGLPLTPLALVPVPETGIVGSRRATLTGAAVAPPAGYYLNPSAYTAVSPGAWGDAGRNSIDGPMTYTLNTGIARSFLWGERVTADWRLDASNLFNQVTYAGVNTIVGSPQFGLPNRANAMRKVQSSLRIRF